MSPPHELSTAPFINLLLYRYLSKGALTVAARDSLTKFGKYVKIFMCVLDVCFKFIRKENYYENLS